MKSVTILGSTGSIGQNTLDLIRHHTDRFKVLALTAHSNINVLIPQINEFSPEYVCVVQEEGARKLKEMFPELNIVTGEAGLVEISALGADITMAAIVGMAGLLPTMKAIEQSKIVAFASKECLVGAGNIMMDAVERCGTTFLPVDSEHNAIFQVFEERQREHIERLVLTSSGGPFLNTPLPKLAHVTPEEAVKHPNWSMGAKISVDSSTMMNKALEVIEAHYLFNMPAEKIDVVIHPQSLIHSMVEYSDGSFLAQLGENDMRTPIAYALAYPSRMRTSGKRLDLTSLIQMQFMPVDDQRFPSIKLAYNALKQGAESCLVMNAANEVLVDAFLRKRIAYLDIVKGIHETMDTYHANKIMTLEDVVEMDKDVRGFMESNIMTKFTA